MVWLAMVMATAAPLDTWLGEAPLEADVRVLRKLAESADPDADPAILGSHTRLEWRADGTLVERMHRAYLVRSDETAEGWGYVTQSWSPWHENPLRLDARVIQEDGGVVSLDPDSIVEESRSQANATSYSDGKTRNAPLPAMQRGVIVEEVIEWERSPLVPGVPVHTVESGWSNVVYPQSTVTLLAPRDVGVVLSVHGELVDESPHREGALRGTRITMPAWDPETTIPTQRPVDQQAIAHVVASAPTTWEAAAQAYRLQVEPILQAADVQALVARVQTDAPEPQLQVDRAAQIVRDDIRYVAMALGENAIIPHTPAETLSDGFGDCKDKATVLAALLRALGHEAWLTLINTGPGWDVDPSVPALGAFDHAIVALQLSDGSLRFIDPTDPYTPVDELPFADQGRRVLVIKPGTTELMLTPMGQAQDHAWHDIFDLTFGEAGMPATKEATTATGRFAADARDQDVTSHAKRVENYETWGEERVGDATRVIDLTVTGDDAYTREWRRTIEWEHMNRGDADGVEVVMWMPFVDEIAWAVPELLLWEDEDDWTLADRPYGVRIDPFDTSTTWNAKVLDGFDLRYAPEDDAKTFGGITYSRRVEQDGSNVSVTVRMAADAHVLSVDDAVAFRDWAVRESESDVWQVQWVDTAYQLSEMGRRYQSIMERAAFARQDANRPYNQISLSSQLTEAGFNDLATRVVTDVNERFEDIAAGWRIRASAAGRNAYGVYGEEHWDALAILDYLDRSLEHEPDSPEALQMRAAFAMLVPEEASPGIQQSVDDFRRLAELGVQVDDSYLIVEFLRREDYDGLREYGASRTEANWQIGNLAARWALTQQLGPVDSPEVRAQVAAQLLQADDVDRARAVVQGVDPSQTNTLAPLVRLLQAEPGDANPRRNPSDALLVAFQTLAAGEPLDEVVASDAPDDIEEWLISDGRALQWSNTTFAALMAGLPITAEGSDEVGYRLAAASEITNGPVGYVVRERGRYRLLATATDLRSVVGHALQRAEAGDTAAAHQWLEWYFEQEERGDGRTDVMTTAPAAFLWNYGTSDDLVMVAAAALAQLPDTPERVADLLLQAQPIAQGEDAVAIAIALTFLHQVLVEDAELHPVAERVFQHQPEHPWAQVMYVSTAPDPAALEQAIAVLQTGQPLDDRVASVIGSRFARWGDARAIEWLEPLATSPTADTTFRNSYAWYLATFEPTRAEDALRIMRSANTDGWNQGDWHTLASLELLAGEPSRAFDAYEAALTQFANEGLLDAWANVRAQLLASWGYYDEARAELQASEYGKDEGASRTWMRWAAEAVDAAEQAAQ